jgi:hypothetical protein
MKITIDISPEEVIDLTKGNTEVMSQISTQVVKSVTETMTKEMIKQSPEWWNWWKK